MLVERRHRGAPVAPVVIVFPALACLALLAPAAHGHDDEGDGSKRGNHDANDRGHRETLLGAVALKAIVHAAAEECLQLLVAHVGIRVVHDVYLQGESLGHRVVVGVLVLHGEREVERAALRGREGKADGAALARLEVAHVLHGRLGVDAVAGDAHGHVGHGGFALVDIGDGDGGLFSHRGVVGRDGVRELEAVGLEDRHRELDLGVCALALAVLHVLVLEADGHGAGHGLVAGDGLEVERLLLQLARAQVGRVEGVRAAVDGELVARVHRHHEVLHGEGGARVGEGKRERERAACGNCACAVAVGEVAHDDVGYGLVGGAGRRGLLD